MTKTTAQTSSTPTEMTILGAILNHPEYASIGLERLDEDCFFETKHKIIFKAIREVFSEKQVVDVSLLCSKLKSAEQLNNVGGIQYIVSLQQTVGVTFYMEAHCDDLLNLKTTRQLYSLHRDLGNDITSGEDNTKIIDRYEKQFEDIKKSKANADSAFRYLLDNNSEEKVIKDMNDVSPGVSTGFTIGDVELKFPGGALAVAALPTSHGKTSILINTSLGALEQHKDIDVYFFSYEENEAAIMSLFLNAYIGKDLSANNRNSIQSYFRTGTTEFMHGTGTTRDDFRREKNAFFKDLIDTGRLKVFYTDMSVEHLIASIRFIKKHTKVGLICIDYIQCLRLLQRPSGSRQEELKDISQLLKNVAVETGLPIVLGAQFSRQVVCEADLSPIYIREAADIEHIASLIIGGWNRNFKGFTREGNIMKNGKVAPVESAIYLEVLKGRGIGNGHNCVMDFNGNAARISNRRQNTSPKINSNGEEIIADTFNLMGA